MEQYLRCMVTVSVKNMVCNRCVAAVRQVFEQAGILPAEVTIGEVRVEQPIPAAVMQEIEAALAHQGFEVLDDSRSRLIEKIKTLLIGKVQSGEIEEHFSITTYLTKNLHRDYPKLSRLFSEVEGITIEQFFILQKIEKVKEWLVYDELTLSEISWKLGYSSVAHLSSQFKKVTGMTPTDFRKMGPSHRRPLDRITF
ncbi:MAG TPA: helix-turn-helix domain-containing protein [Flavisolibacter sp.]